MKRRERPTEEFTRELKRDSQLLKLHTELEKDVRLRIGHDGEGTCLFKVYLPLRDGPKEGFLRAMTPFDKSYIDWSQQPAACRNAFSSLVKNARNKDGSQLRSGVSVDEVVQAVRQFVDALRAASPPA